MSVEFQTMPTEPNDLQSDPISMEEAIVMIPIRKEIHIVSQRQRRSQLIKKRSAAFLLGFLICVVVFFAGIGICRRFKKPISSSDAQTIAEGLTVRGGCAAGWFGFQRNNGLVWCIHLSSPDTDNSTLTQPEAQMACEQMGANLTGFQSLYEQITIGHEALNRLNAMSGTSAGILVGATYNEECKTRNCDFFEAFQWKDGFTTGFDHTRWGTAEPYSTRFNQPSECVQQLVFTSDLHAGRNFTTSVSGGLDNYNCSERLVDKVFFACGRKGH